MTPPPAGLEIECASFLSVNHPAAKPEPSPLLAGLMELGLTERRDAGRFRLTPAGYGLAMELLRRPEGRTEGRT